MTRESRHKSPDELIIELGITKPEEIDINAIAEYCQAHIVYQHLNGCDGRIIGNETDSIITVNSALPLTRQRFTAAHELGHWMSDRGITVILHSDTDKTIELGWSPQSIELRANEYAASLLMPTILFKPKCVKKKPSLSLIDTLAEQFITSLSATSRRYIDFSDERCAIVFSCNKHIHSFKCSKDFGYWIPVNAPLDKYSLATDYFDGKTIPARMESVDASCWIKGAFKHDSMIKEESRALPNYNLVISLLWIDKDIDINNEDWDDSETFTPDGQYRRRK